MEAIKRLPIGISDFKTLQRSQKYFVDKTMYLPLLEKISNFLFLIRPRRLARVCFVNGSRLLRLRQQRYRKEYQGTWIETHPLESKGKFQILQFDFSQVLDRVENLETDFNTYCCSCLNQFVQNTRTIIQRHGRMGFGSHYFQGQNQHSVQRSQGARLSSLSHH